MRCALIRMPGWIPKDNAPVGSNEHIGRRLFDEPKLFGATDQRRFDGLELRNFEPTSDREFSVDRVGDSCFNSTAQTYLLPRAVAAGRNEGKSRTFHGWLTVTARTLTLPRSGKVWRIIASPDRGPPADDGSLRTWSYSDLTQNRYHAHVPLPDGMESEYFAHVAREIFRKGRPFVAPGAVAPEIPGLTPSASRTRLQQWAWSQSWLGKLRRFVWGDD
jgi:hypothetical protein